MRSCGQGGSRMGPRFPVSTPVWLVLPNLKLGCLRRGLRVGEEERLNGGAFETSNRCQVGSWI